GGTAEQGRLPARRRGPALRQGDRGGGPAETGGRRADGLRLRPAPGEGASVNDPIDRLMSERADLDRGFPGGLILSGAVHLLLVGAAIAGPLLLPQPPLIRIMHG